MALAVLLQTSLRSAEATVERLGARGIEAVLVDRPNAIAWLLSGGTYRARVAVPEEALAEARAEIGRWEAEAAPRIRELAHAAQRGMLLASLPALALALGIGLARPASALGWIASFLLWLAGLAVWGVRSRAHARAPSNGTGSNAAGAP